MDQPMSIKQATEPRVVIESGFSGEAWRYGASGISGLWVSGGCEYSADRYTFRFTDIQAIHHRIGEWIVEQSELTGSLFRFLRKELRLTADDVAAQGFDLDGILECELNDGPVSSALEKLIRTNYGTWRTVSRDCSRAGDCSRAA